MTSRGRRLIVLSALLATIAVLPIRGSLLRGLGRILVVEDVSQPSEVVVVAVDAYDAGVLEASDLVRAGTADQVAVFTDPPNPVDREFLRRGVAYNDAGARAVRQLEELGVARVLQIRRTTAEGSQEMSELLRHWCQEQDIRSMVVVTAPDHSRRVQRLLRRSLNGLNVRVLVRPTRYADFDPDHWWETRAGQRMAIIELQKLALDFILHPLS